ncbi:MAG: SUKH-4 family immunity protein [Thermoleophilaceae bacterium]|nr:SUKH-4 family immunity protein [Thermoleophilaceae bacterium]
MSPIPVEILVLNNGSVVARLEEREWFINSSQDQYGDCLLLVSKVRDSPGDGSDEEVEELDAKLRRIDPAALDDPNSYWSIIVEQLRAELF